jgi:hypothetical protein
MALVYRANRIISCAQGDLGLVPKALALDLIVFSVLSFAWRWSSGWRRGSSSAPWSSWRSCGGSSAHPG